MEELNERQKFRQALDRLLELECALSRLQEQRDNALWTLLSFQPELPTLD